MPVYHAASPAPLWPAADVLGTTFPSALVVEDDAWVADLLGLLLQPLATEILIAKDGATAEDYFYAHAGSIGWVIMDCSLPDLPANELAHRLRAASPRIPILLTSGRHQEELLEQLRMDGPVEFLQKPFGRGELMARLRALFEIRVGA